jgi:enolase-phosphatase E1
MTLQSPMDRPISHVLLDIEGTTCPVSFVADTLFPYAARRLEQYLQEHAKEPIVRERLRELFACWRKEDNPTAQALLSTALSKQEALAEPQTNVVLPYLLWLIAEDRKVTPLKDLQGMVWEEGYRRGELVAPLFTDVPETLRRWHSQGLVLSVYSSGSVAAQQLLYAHSHAGDLRPLFSHWFDTRSGPKQEPDSYRRIADQLKVSADQILFISDLIAELKAAERAGLAVLFSDRKGNPQRNPETFPMIHSFATLDPRHCHHRS